jgi:sugar lactone lactonase YvrE
LWQYGGGLGGGSGGVAVSSGDNAKAHGLLNMPRGCALNDDQSMLAVVDAENNRIVVLRTADGALMQTFGAEEAGAGQLNMPSCVAHASSGRVWVSDASHHRVLCFAEDAQHHRRAVLQLGTTAEAGTDDDHFTIPAGVCAHDGLLFVADFRNHRVQVYDERSGEFVATIGGAAQGAEPGQLAGPEGLCVDAGRALLYVCEGINKRVSVFSSAPPFAYVGRITTPAPARDSSVVHHHRPPLSEFQYPIAAAVDSLKGEVFVSDFSEGKVHVFAAF